MTVDRADDYLSQRGRPYLRGTNRSRRNWTRSPIRETSNNLPEFLSDIRTTYIEWVLADRRWRLGRTRKQKADLEKKYLRWEAARGGRLYRAPGRASHIGFDHEGIITLACGGYFWWDESCSVDDPQDVPFLCLNCARTEAAERMRSDDPRAVPSYEAARQALDGLP